MDHTQGCVCMRVHPFGSESRSVYDGCTIHMCNLSYAVLVSSIFQLNIPPPCLGVGGIFNFIHPCYILYLIRFADLGWIVEIACQH